MQTLIVDKIVNCTGPSTDYHTTENTLFKQLLNKGWMKQDVLKLGVETGYRGEIIQQNGVILRNAFAIGPVRRAAEWETTAMREIRTQAENIATILSQPAEKGYEMILNVGL